MFLSLSDSLALLLFKRPFFFFFSLEKFCRRSLLAVSESNSKAVSFTSLTYLLVMGLLDVLANGTVGIMKSPHYRVAWARKILQC